MLKNVDLLTFTGRKTQIPARAPDGKEEEKTMKMELLDKQRLPIKRVPEILKIMRESGANEAQAWAAIKVYLMGLIDGKREERQKRK